MKELDLLKKDWNKNDNYPKFSEQEIYAMLHKNSSSVVKWILITSILELLLWSGMNLIFKSDDYIKKNNISSFMEYFYVVDIFHYTIIAVFIIAFYKNYRNISVISSTKNLMDSILKTRKTVQYYIWYNLGMIAFSFILGAILAFNSNVELEKLSANTDFKYGFLIGFSLVLVIVMVLFWFVYRLIYGTLLRKLLKNHKELKKINL